MFQKNRWLDFVSNLAILGPQRATLFVRPGLSGGGPICYPSDMPWTRRKFTIASEDGAGKTVSGWTSNGLGVHRFPASKRDSLGRQRWAVSHLNTGLFILYVNAKDAETATRIADLIVNEVDWTGMTSPDEFAEKDPEWIARLLGIKHTLGGDSIEFLNPAMNDPANIVMMDRKMTKQ